jgi:hypothetical protein
MGIAYKKKDDNQSLPTDLPPLTYPISIRAQILYQYVPTNLTLHLRFIIYINQELFKLKKVIIIKKKN